MLTVGSDTVLQSLLDSGRASRRDGKVVCVDLLRLKMFCRARCLSVPRGVLQI